MTASTTRIWIRSVLGTALVLAAVVGGVWLLTALHRPVDADSLANSLAHRVRSGGDGSCTKTRRAVWRCAVLDRRGSGGVRYRVWVREGSSCWHARLTGGTYEGPMPIAPRGCVHRLEL